MFHWLIPRSRRVHKREDGLRPMSELTQRDAHFDIGDLQERITNLNLQLFQGFCKADLSPLQPYVTDDMYEKLLRYARQYTDKGWKLHIVRPCVLRCEALGCRLEADETRIFFRVQTRMIRFATDDKRDVVEGVRGKELFELKTWELARPTQTVTGDRPELESTNCPSCGGVLNAYASAICPSCGTAVRVKRFDWLIRMIE